MYDEEFPPTVGTGSSGSYRKLVWDPRSVGASAESVPSAWAWNRVGSVPAGGHDSAVRHSPP